MKAHNTSSLLPYLDSARNHFFLEISVVTEDAPALEKAPFPFAVISDSDPLSRLMEGRLVSDSGSEIKRVFLLVQKDQYPLPKDALWPFHNLDVAEYWQRAFSFYQGEKGNSPLIILADQLTEEKKLSPFQPLFFCKTKKLFFHPPCPSCGSALSLCSDDALLTQAGLQPYATSLKRYLFCPTCHSKESADFFVNELETSDPPMVKDRRTLIREFGNLLKDRQPGARFPCADCSVHAECYGLDHRALSRVVPFSFYPFYALLFESMTLHALDFLSLLSGGTFEEVESSLKTRGELGRIRCLKAWTPKNLPKVPSLFEGDEKHFGEVLFLKLSFLGELLQDILTEGEIFRHPGLRFSLDRIWVQLGESRGLLPPLWDFRVKWIDLYQNPGQSLPRSPGCETLVFSGLVWCYTLLVNQKQDMVKIFPLLEKATDSSPSPRDDSLWERIPEENRSLFLPENIFWRPDGKRVSEEWRSIWERALHLGWQLLRSGWQAEARGSMEDFWTEWKTLQGEVKKNLFEPAVIASPRPVSPETEDLHHILSRIIQRWQAKRGAEGEELKETVIRSTPKAEKGPPAEDRIPETVILSPGKSEKGEPEKSVPETVILSSAPKAPRSRAEGAVKREKAGFLDKPQASQQGKATQPPGQRETVPDDLLEETVILSPDKLKELSKKDR